MTNSPYYKDTGKIALASKISVQFREKMFARFMEKMKPDAKHKILDIGVTNDDRYQESNYFERLYPVKDRIVCVGTEDGSYLETKYPGIKFIQISPGERLPFDNHEFDIAFSNAVIEHVGNRENQKAFILEMLRVSRSFFLTTPNRWFPVELHTAIPFLHFLPKNIYRKLLMTVGETYWSKEENLNLLSRNELSSLFPEEINVIIDSVKMFGLSTNLIAYASFQNNATGVR
jgi:SAM-dependent methyltransferase